MTDQPTSFADLGLSPELLKAVTDAGYENPSPIQEKSIPLVLMGRDLLGCAQTGTGKTAAFSLPIIDILAQGIARARMPRALIISPTRELAQQISENFTTYNKFHKLSQSVLIGGESMPDQQRSLSKHPDVIIATPGRLIDMADRGKVMLGGIKILVIDEADRMLDMGFIPDVTRIVEMLPRIRQTLLFSATLGAEIRALADAFLINPKEVSVAPPASIAKGVTHTMISVPKFPKDKRAALRQVMEHEDVQSALVFCNRKKDITVLRNSLRRHGFEAEELHGDMAQHRRTETLAAYKKGDIKLLICSDVAGRGLDIQGVSHVFNFDVPNNAESYVHRIGRTGRAGREGRAITLVTSEDAKYVDAIFKLIRVNIPILPLNAIGTQTPALAAIEAPVEIPIETPTDTPVDTPIANSVNTSEITEPETDANAREATDSRNKTRGRRTRTRAGAEDNGSKEKPVRSAPDNGARRRRPKEAEPRAVGNGRTESGGGDKVIGMGDHFPDFLREPSKPKRGGKG